MKHKVLLMLSVLAFSLGSCSKSNNENSAPQNNKLDLYTDKCSFVEDNLEFNFKMPTERKLGETYDLDIALEVINRNVKPVDFSIDKHLIIRETNNAEYSTSIFSIFPISLECDIKKTIAFSATLPTSFKDDKYSLNIKYGNKEVTYHFYEMPDEMKKPIVINYVVDGKNVGTKNTLEGKTFVNYYWADTDYINGCCEWYLDNAFTNKIAEDYVLNENVTVYGQKQTILKYNQPDGTDSSFVSGYNFIPESNEIVIPKSYGGKSVYGILAGSFRGECPGLKNIYIPKTLTSISSSHNFSLCIDLERIYFEGNQAEWEAINQASFPYKTRIVYNSYK